MGRKKGTRKKIHRSIIDHTMTCGYCGHRILASNEEDHLKKRHLEHYEREILVKRLSRNKANSSCPHCGAMVELHDLEEHIRKYHPAVIQQIAKTLSLKEKRELRENRKKRLKIAMKYGTVMETEDERDPDAPWEWRLAESQSKTKALQTTRISKQRPVMNVPMKPSKPQAPQSIDKAIFTPSDYALYKCMECSKLVTGFMKNDHVQNFHRGRQMEWKKIGG